MATASLRLGPATLPPGDCFMCASRPVDEEGNPHEFIYPEGMDINWGETPYICWDCAGIIADLLGRPEGDKVSKVLRGAQAQKKHNERLIEENKELRAVVEGLINGSEGLDRAKELVGHV